MGMFIKSEVATASSGTDPAGFSWNTGAPGGTLTLPYKYDIAGLHAGYNDGDDCVGRWNDTNATGEQARYYTGVGFDGNDVVRIQPATASGGGQCYAGIAAGTFTGSPTRICIAYPMLLTTGLAGKMGDNDKMIVINGSTGENFHGLLHPHASNIVCLTNAKDGAGVDHSYVDVTPSFAFGSSGIGNTVVWVSQTCQINTLQEWRVWSRDGTWDGTTNGVMTQTSDLITTGYISGVQLIGGFWNAVVPTLTDGVDYLEIHRAFYIADAAYIPPPAGFVTG